MFDMYARQLHSSCIFFFSLFHWFRERDTTTMRTPYVWVLARACVFVCVNGWCACVRVLYARVRRMYTIEMK